MQDHTAGVDDAAQPWRNPGPQARPDHENPLHILEGSVSSLRGHLRAKSLDHAPVPELLQELGVFGLVDQGPNGGQGRSPMNPGIA